MSGLSIYATEYRAPPEKRDNDYFHSFLCLVEECTDAQRILEELHFYLTEGKYIGRSDGWYIYSEVRSGGRPIDERLIMGGHIGGPRDVIKTDWDKGVNFAKSYDLFRVDVDDFGCPYVPNCRAGVRTVLQHIQLDFYDVVEGPDAQYAVPGSLAALPEPI